MWQNGGNPRRGPAGYEGFISDDLGVSHDLVTLELSQCLDLAVELLTLLSEWGRDKYLLQVL